MGEVTRQHDLYHELTAQFDYNPETGKLFRRSKPDAEFGKDKDGYIQVSVTYYQDGVKLRKVMRGHQIAWILMYEDLPEEGTIDHINQNRTDNRKENLRAASRKMQARNRSTNNGVVKDSSGWWIASITMDNGRTLTKKFPPACETQARKWREIYEAKVWKDER